VEFRLSPSFEHSKLENPSLEDFIDVYEDLWRSYIFQPAATLLESEHGGIAAMTILSSYFEAIESYICGRKSEGKSGEFFVKLTFRSTFRNKFVDRYFPYYL